MQKCFLLKRRGASLSELEDEKTEKPKTEKPKTEKPKVRVKRLPHRRISTTFPAQKVRELVELRVSRHRSNPPSLVVRLLGNFFSIFLKTLLTI